MDVALSRTILGVKLSLFSYMLWQSATCSWFINNYSLFVRVLVVGCLKWRHIARFWLKMVFWFQDIGWSLCSHGWKTLVALAPSKSINHPCEHLPSRLILICRPHFYELSHRGLQFLLWIFVHKRTNIAKLMVRSNSFGIVFHDSFPR